jgi:hypothetical protein
MRHYTHHSVRMAELRAIVEAYRSMTVEEAEESDAGDREVEAVAELWRLEQEVLDRMTPAQRGHAA